MSQPPVPQLDKFLAEFENTCPEQSPRLNLQAIVESARPRIETLRKLGYSLDSIARLLRTLHIAISSSTLSRYLLNSHQTGEGRKPEPGAALNTKPEAKAKAEPRSEPKEASSLEDSSPPVVAAHPKKAPKQAPPPRVPVQLLPPTPAVATPTPAPLVAASHPSVKSEERKSVADSLPPPVRRDPPDAASPPRLYSFGSGSFNPPKPIPSDQL